MVLGSLGIAMAMVSFFVAVDWGVLGAAEPQPLSNKLVDTTKLSKTIDTDFNRLFIIWMPPLCILGRIFLLSIIFNSIDKVCNVSNKSNYAFEKIQNVVAFKKRLP
ncbi:exported hypothetical protein [Candidatus Desulfosporosinus infrequens]|uniref:Uncharacterized protein n=1 Tax=Candidatus Desulfosporosinus infrequens TaxID=2043169 RepID=A0A2U3LYJ1_9FIRM|nr:exported hypothetical protein [Candidatus Desulfosporosinus infrequens]